MKDLNSILLEGEVLAKPRVAHSKSGEAYSVLKLDTINRFAGNTGFAKVEHNHFTVELGTGLAEKYRDGLQPGARIRVVGLLKVRANTVRIHTEDMEVRRAHSPAA